MNPFETLGSEPRFDLDLGALEKRHRELSRALHPDKYAQAGASERRAALEKAAQVNEAWRIVRDPIRRAEVLFRIAGVEVGETKEPKPDQAFLMEMLELREQLAEARAQKDRGKFDAISDEILARREKAEKKLAEGLARGGDIRALLPLLGELRFYRRFEEAAEDVELP